mgnify:CR=1 FL=1
MNELLDVSRVLVSLFFLLYASWSDLETREVSNWVWVLYAPVAFFLTILRYGLFNQDFILSFVVTLALSLTLFYAGGFGGADAKALICLSLALPIYPVDLLPPTLGVYLPFLFPLSVFINAVFLSLISVVYILVRNFLWKYRNKKKLFEGFEKESLGRKVLVLISGYKVNIATLEKKSYLIPLEDFAETEEKRKLIAMPRDEEREEIVSKLLAAKRDGHLPSDVWATPGLPMLVFITVGFVVALFFGDILLTILTSLAL